MITLSESLFVDTDEHKAHPPDDAKSKEDRVPKYKAQEKSLLGQIVYPKLFAFLILCFRNFFMRPGRTFNSRRSSFLIRSDLVPWFSL